MSVEEFTLFATLMIILHQTYGTVTILNRIDEIEQQKQPRVDLPAVGEGVSHRPSE